jgi:hypothetical protein
LGDLVWVKKATTWFGLIMGNCELWFDGEEERLQVTGFVIVWWLWVVLMFWDGGSMDARVG